MGLASYRVPRLMTRQSTTSTDTPTNGDSKPTTLIVVLAAVIPIGVAIIVLFFIHRWHLRRVRREDKDYDNFDTDETHIPEEAVLDFMDEQQHKHHLREDSASSPNSVSHLNITYPEKTYSAGNIIAPFMMQNRESVNSVAPFMDRDDRYNLAKSSHSSASGSPMLGALSGRTRNESVQSMKLAAGAVQQQHQQQQQPVLQPQQEKPVVERQWASGDPVESVNSPSSALSMRSNSQPSSTPQPVEVPQSIKSPQTEHVNPISGGARSLPSPHSINVSPVKEDRYVSPEPLIEQRSLSPVSSKAYPIEGEPRTASANDYYEYDDYRAPTQPVQPYQSYPLLGRSAIDAFPQPPTMPTSPSPVAAPIPTRQTYYDYDNDYSLNDNYDDENAQRLKSIYGVYADDRMSREPQVDMSRSQSNTSSMNQFNASYYYNNNQYQPKLHGANSSAVSLTSRGYTPSVLPLEPLQQVPTSPHNLDDRASSISFVKTRRPGTPDRMAQQHNTIMQGVSSPAASSQASAYDGNLFQRPMNNPVLASSYDQLMEFPSSPHAVPRSDSWTALDFAPRTRRGSDVGSDATNVFSGSRRDLRLEGVRRGAGHIDNLSTDFVPPLVKDPASLRHHFQSSGNDNQNWR